MFFRSRRHKPARGSPRVAEEGDAGGYTATLRQAKQLMEWRRSAQRVTRAWNAWLAAERRDRSVRYRAFLAALADEASAAAELERVINRGEAGHSVTTIDARKSGLGAR